LIVKEEYEEDVTVNVFITVKGASQQNVFRTEINSMKEFNSWFNVDFGESVFVPKGAKCIVEVKSSNTYQLVPYTHIKENIEKAKKCAEVSQFELGFIEIEKKYDTRGITKCLEKDGDFLFCMKSLSVVPVDDQGFLNTT